MNDRDNLRASWLKSIFKDTPITEKPLAGDASFRRYYRLHTLKESYVVMDAPPNQENIIPFIHLAKKLNQNGIKAPHIIEKNTTDGFLLLEDFGDTLFFTLIHTEYMQQGYQVALAIIPQLFSMPTDSLPIFDALYRFKEMQLCIDWYFLTHLGLTLSNETIAMIHKAFNTINQHINKQPTTFIHRDFHSRNIMLLTDHPLTMGIIDFQDAMIGPYTYDIVSLLKDAYIKLPYAMFNHLLRFSFEQLPPQLKPNFDTFKADCLMSGLQRHLKVLGIFSRLFYRDKKAIYLKDLPLVQGYVLEALASMPELHDLYDFFNTLKEENIIEISI